MSRTPKPGLDPGPRLEGTTRVDAAHATTVTEEAGDQLPSIELLEAIAGQGPQAATQQLRGQALELAGILREKQRLLEQRESELNARTALLENELRQARLKQYRDLPSIDEPTRTPGYGVAGAVPPLAEIHRSVLGNGVTAPRAEPAGNEPQAGPGAQNRDFDWNSWDTETLAADTAAAVPNFATHDAIIETDLADAARQAEAEHWRQHAQAADPGAAERAINPATEALAADCVASSERVVNGELQAEYEHLEQQRRLHRQREFRLERREKSVEQLHDEVTLLHREALELRLATEQIWSELTEDHPQEQLAQSLAELRSKMTDHYRMANDCLARRKDELHQLRAEITLQEQRVRQQRRDIQLWADRRYDEIEARAAKLLVRERELDQIEGDFQRQTLEWQKQRDAFRQQIESLRGRMAS